MILSKMNFINRALPFPLNLITQLRKSHLQRVEKCHGGALRESGRSQKGFIEWRTLTSNHLLLSQGIHYHFKDKDRIHIPKGRSSDKAPPWLYKTRCTPPLQMQNIFTENTKKKTSKRWGKFFLSFQRGRNTLFRYESPFKGWSSTASYSHIC